MPNSEDNQNQDAQTQITVPVQNQQAAAPPSFSEKDLKNMIQQQKKHLNLLKKIIITSDNPKLI